MRLISDCATQVTRFGSIDRYLHFLLPFYIRGYYPTQLQPLRTSPGDRSFPSFYSGAKHYESQWQTRAQYSWAIKFKAIKSQDDKKIVVSMNKKPSFKKIKKRRWDAVLIGVAMSIAFAVILMRFTDYWPCDMLGTLKFESIVSCSRTPESNLDSVYGSIQQGAAWIVNLTR
jgi:hypothetical protein